MFALPVSSPEKLRERKHERNKKDSAAAESFFHEKPRKRRQVMSNRGQRLFTKNTFAFDRERDYTIVVTDHY
jgi:hypothetical protein